MERVGDTRAEWEQEKVESLASIELGAELARERVEADTQYVKGLARVRVGPR